MNKRKIIAALLLAAAPSAMAADPSPVDGVQFQTSPFAVCKDATMISNTDFKANEAFWKSAIGECGLDVQVLPDTGFFNTMVGRLGGVDDAKRSVDFMQKVGDRAGSYIDTNIQLADNLRHCALKDDKWFAGKMAEAKSPEEKKFYDFASCGDALGKLRDSIKDIGPKVRTDIGVITNTAGPWNTMKNALKNMTGVNLAIEAQKPVGDEPKKIANIVQDEKTEFEAMVASDIKKYQGMLKDMRAKGNKEDIENLSEFPAWFKFWMTETVDGAHPENSGAQTPIAAATLEYSNAKIAKHKQDITDNLGKLPVLAYLNKDDASDAELAAAMGKVIDNANATKKEVARLMSTTLTTRGAGGRSGGVGSGTHVLTPQERTKQMLEIMKFGPIVQEVLKEDPASCNTATGIANSIANTEMRNNVGLMAGMLGTMGAAAVVGPAVLGGAAVMGAAAGPAMATGIGLAFSAGMYTKDYQNFADAKRRTFSVVDTQNGGKAVSSVEDFETARDSLLTDIALSPTDLMGTGIMTGTVTAAGITAGRLFAKPLERMALKKALMNKGLKDEVVEGLFKQMQSDKPAIAAAATRKVVMETGLDPDKVKFLRMAASKGIFKEQNPEAMKAVLAEVKNADTYTKAMKIMEDVNSAKMNAGNRDSVLKAAIAGAEFGVTDPKRLAGVINDWDEGLDGLARTYQIAAKKLETPQIRGLASVEQRQQAAFRSALEDLRAENPNLKAMPEKEWTEMRESMMSCPIKPLH